MILDVSLVVRSFAWILDLGFLFISFLALSSIARFFNLADFGSCEFSQIQIPVLI